MTNGGLPEIAGNWKKKKGWLINVRISYQIKMHFDIKFPCTVDRLWK